MSPRFAIFCNRMTSIDLHSLPRRKALAKADPGVREADAHEGHRDQNRGDVREDHRPCADDLQLPQAVNDRERLHEEGGREHEDHVVDRLPAAGREPVAGEAREESCDQEPGRETAELRAPKLAAEETWLAQAAES